MALKTLVKVGDVNNLSDARYCAGMGVDFVGFNLDEDSKVSTELFIAITEWIEGIKIVGEFESTGSSDIKALHEKLHFDFIQTSNTDLLNDLDISCAKILRINVQNSIIDHKDLFALFDDKVDYFLLESEIITELSDEEAALLDQLSKRYPILLGYGFDAENAEKVLDYINPIGISLKGGEEIRPGYKDFDELADILEVLEIEI